LVKVSDSSSGRSFPPPHLYDDSRVVSQSEDTVVFEEGEEEVVVVVGECSAEVGLEEDDVGEDEVVVVVGMMTTVVGLDLGGGSGSGSKGVSKAQ